MFHTIVILTYLIPNIYLFLRIWSLFIPREWRTIYILVYALLFSVYPASLLSGDGTDNPLFKSFDFVANYLLPFFLYLFLSVLIIDLLLLINLIFKIVKAERITSDSFRLKTLALITVFSMLVVVYGIINFNSIRITEYKVEIQARSSDLINLKVAFVSDFHLNANTPLRFVERFIDKVSKIKPDIMLFGGDIADHGDDNPGFAIIENLLRGINTRFGVYGVLGNHEHYTGQDKGGFFDRAGIKILRDSVVIFGDSFILAGRNDSHFRGRKSIEELLKTVVDSLPVILLDHRPTELDLVSRTNVDIQLSGHTHHGQLFPVNLITKKVYELSYGHIKKGNTHFFVSSGIRLWGPPVRTTAKSEIVVINIEFVR